MAVTITDPREASLPDAGMVELVDAETGRYFTVDTSSEKVRAGYAKNASAMHKDRAEIFGSVGVDHIDISTDRSYVDAFIKFFKMRKRRI